MADVPDSDIAINNIFFNLLSPTNLPRIPQVKWFKHKLICLFIPGNDPPMDITRFIDVSQNPGLKGNNENERHAKQVDQVVIRTRANVESRPLTLTYSWDQLLSLRWSYQLDHEKLQQLKLDNLLRFRGRWAGRHKPTHCSASSCLNNVITHGRNPDHPIQVIFGNRHTCMHKRPKSPSFPSVLKQLSKVLSPPSRRSAQRSTLLPWFLLTNLRSLYSTSLIWGRIEAQQWSCGCGSIYCNLDHTKHFIRPVFCG